MKRKMQVTPKRGWEGVTKCIDCEYAEDINNSICYCPKIKMPTPINVLNACVWFEVKSK